jgi:hypothetical protein
MAEVQRDYTYKRAVRDKTAPLIMISGPPGVGKTYSALRLARGLVGSDGKIFLADTDNGRALFYAEEFTFEHLNLHEPFRPIVFENAALHAHRQGCDCLIIDNFMHEHVGPGGLLEWHQEINVRLATDKDGQVNFRRLEATKMLAWAEPKQSHKRMRERIYQINCPIILCCGAEKKIAMIETEENGRKKTVPTDIGLQPICGDDIPWAMTLSVMLEDPSRPGVPRPIKALLPAFKPIVSLDKPIDEETGARMAAWGRGEKAPASSDPKGPSSDAGSANHPSSESTSDSQKQSVETTDENRQADDKRIEDGARRLADRFLGSADRAAHVALIDDQDVQNQLSFLRRNRKQLYEDIVKPAIGVSYDRAYPKQEQSEGNVAP